MLQVMQDLIFHKPSLGYRYPSQTFLLTRSTPTINYDFFLSYIHASQVENAGSLTTSCRSLIKVNTIIKLFISRVMAFSNWSLKMAIYFVFL